FLHALIVDIRAVGAAFVEKGVAAVGLAKLGVPARDFGVVQADAIGAVATERHGDVAQLELLALIGAFDHEQSGHGTPARMRRMCKRYRVDAPDSSITRRLTRRSS